MRGGGGQPLPERKHYSSIDVFALGEMLFLKSRFKREKRGRIFASRNQNVYLWLNAEVEQKKVWETHSVATRSYMIVQEGF